jgi:hypothetical protein
MDMRTLGGVSPTTAWAHHEVGLAHQARHPLLRTGYVLLLQFGVDAGATITIALRPKNRLDLISQCAIGLLPLAWRPAAPRVLATRATPKTRHSCPGK